MKLAHVSDLHFIRTDALRFSQVFGKRLTGWANLKLRRAAAHRVELARAVLLELGRRQVDHVVITGDFTYLSLPEEFRSARELLEECLPLGPEQISVVPGNHDAYTRQTHRRLLFEQYFAPYSTTHLPDASGLAAPQRFPYVRLVGPAAIIGLSTAVPQPPFVAAGRLGEVQRIALHGVLAHAEVRARLPVLLQHHPLQLPGLQAKAWLEGLRDAPQLCALLGDLPRGLCLHGHLHRRIRHPLETTRGRLDVFGAPSVSLLDPRPTHVAGFNLYELDSEDGSLLDASSVRIDPALGTFHRTAIPWAPRS